MSAGVTDWERAYAFVPKMHTQGTGVRVGTGSRDSISCPVNELFDGDPDDPDNARVRQQNVDPLELQSMAHDPRNEESKESPDDPGDHDPYRLDPIAD